MEASITSGCSMSKTYMMLGMRPKRPELFSEASVQDRAFGRSGSIMSSRVGN